MVYVMSDIHGEFEKYIGMLQKIEFKDEDTLYILGDVVDRGERPVDILLDMMSRPNVYPLLGNHELMAIDMLRTLNVEITDKNYDTHIDEAVMQHLIEWQMDGGDTTMKQFRKLSLEERENVLDYLEEFLPYELVKVGKRKFLLVHAGLGNFSAERDIYDYTLEELTCMRPDLSVKYFDDDNFFVITGHTPTIALNGKAEIYKKQNNICIDCGATFSGKLACLCLDTMKEFYV